MRNWTATWMGERFVISAPDGFGARRLVTGTMKRHDGAIELTWGCASLLRLAIVPSVAPAAVGLYLAVLAVKRMSPASWAGAVPMLLLMAVPAIASVATFVQQRAPSGQALAAFAEAVGELAAQSEPLSGPFR